MLRMWRAQGREEVVRDQGAGEYCCEIVNVSSANLINVRKQEKETVVSVVLIIVRGGEVTAGLHGTAGSWLETEKAVLRSRRDGTLHPGARCIQHKLSVTGVTKSHVTDCCELLFGDGTVGGHFGWWIKCP